MKCKIMSETNGRLRVRMIQFRMTFDQADLLQYYLKALPGVRKVKVYDRTCDAVVQFDPSVRNEIIQAFSEFSYEESEVAVPAHTDRVLQREFENKLVRHIGFRLITRLFLPAPFRLVCTLVRAVPYIKDGLASLFRGRLDVAVLDAASISVSLIRGEFDTAGNVMFLLGIGEIMEQWTYRKSVVNLAQAMSLNVFSVWKRNEDGSETEVPLDDIVQGDQIVVRTGHVIPLDGVVVEGDSMINQSSITGESVAVHKEPGGYVYAGTVVEEGECILEVRQAAGEGKFDRIVSMIEESEKLKSKTEKQAEELADKLVPWTLGAALLTLLLTRNVTKAAAVLMVDYCCALKLSIPVAVLSAMRESSERGITVKGGKFLEAVAQAETIVFDKTGTLTHAMPKVREVVPFGGGNETELLRIAACLEEHYPHSIANAVVAEAALRRIDHEEMHTEIEYVVAHGIASTINHEKVCIGSRHFLFEDEGCVIPEGEQEKFDSLPEDASHLYLSIGGKLAAVLLIEDPLREEAVDVIRALHDAGFQRIVMLTGDSEHTARRVAETIGVDEYRAEVLPEDKAAFVRNEHAAGRKVIMIGDGINDSPALSEADAGIAVTSGSAIAQEISDITISSDDLMDLVTLRKLSSGLNQRINRSYRAILVFNTFLMVMGLTGIFTPMISAVLHNGSTVLIGMNSLTDLLPSEKKETVIL